MIEHEINLKEKGLIKRLTNKTFQFDKRFKDGFYTANYFLKSQEIVVNNFKDNVVMMQFFQRADNVHVCGLDECIALLKEFSPHPENLTVYALNDGDLVQSGEPVLKIVGPYQDFGFLESAIDGILARRSSVCTNCFEVVKACNGKKILNMADRQDDPYTQAGDGYAAYVAGMRFFSTDAQCAWTNLKAGGTMPHALIALCNGDILKASDLYIKQFPNAPFTALIDYHNNVVWDTIKLADHLKEKLTSVRIDTSKSLIDHYFDDKDTSGFDPHGVCKELVLALRHELDIRGYNFVKIVVSSGFSLEKIKEFERLNIPVDVYGIGTNLIKNWVGFTGDLVKVNGKDEAKEGRHEIFSSRLIEEKLV